MSEHGFEHPDDQDEGDFDMEFVVDTNGELTEEDMVSTGSSKTVDAAGKYHCILIGCKKEKPKKLEEPKEGWKDGQKRESAPCIQLTFKVLAGDHPEQVDKLIYHRLYMWEWNAEILKHTMRTGKSLESSLQIATAIGARFADPVDETKWRLNFNNVEQRQTVCEVRKITKDYKTKKELDKPRFEIPFGNVWVADHPSQADVPKNPEYMAIWINRAANESNEPVNLFG